MSAVYLHRLIYRLEQSYSPYTIEYIESQLDANPQLKDFYETKKNQVEKSQRDAEQRKWLIPDTPVAASAVVSLPVNETVVTPMAMSAPGRMVSSRRSSQESSPTPSEGGLRKRVSFASVEGPSTSGSPRLDAKGLTPVSEASDVVMPEQEPPLQAKPIPPPPVSRQESEKEELFRTPSRPNRRQKSFMGTDGLPSKTKDILAQESQKQEHLSQNLLSLTSKLKSNALTFQERLAKDNAVVASTETLLENNVTGMKGLSQRLAVTSLRNQSLFCVTCVGIFITLLLFIVTFVVIRFF